MNGFNDKKSIDHLHENGNVNDETDSKPQGAEEVCVVMCYYD